ncbi:MAG: polysaccharide biosynthesis protein [Bacteroidota bacterium]
MFIVVPYLTSNPPVYGIYTVCISVSIFLAYADLGFMGAGQKYAAEHFARGETEQEIKVIGFTSFVLFIFLLVFTAVFLYLSINPGLLLKDLVPGKETSIASSLLLILALFTPITLLQRLLQMIFGIRLEDYIIQRTNIVASLVKISSVLWFFRNGQYNIVGYFLFVQIVNFLSAIIALVIARQLYNYNFKALASSVRFNKEVFAKTKTLALTSLYLTIIWILYYELDSVIIGKFIGASKVAIYAIGLTVLSFFRSILGILFSPFSFRFNHFIGVNDLEGLKRFYLQITIVMAPLVVIPIISISLFAKSLILSWVGNDYIESVEIARFLVLCNLFAFITYPAGMLLMAQERIKEMYFVNTLIPIVFWLGVALTYPFWGLKSFAVFKLIAFGISAIVYYFVIVKFLNITVIQLMKKMILPLLLPVLFLVIVSFFVKNFVPYEKSKLNVLIIAMLTGGCIIGTFFIQYVSSAEIRKTVKGLIASAKK